ncbi:MAG: tRNA dihydrouridine synthase DusB [Pseudohongiellaceae bacterium]|jgi:tRNA-dihydrouridine synthase B
MAASLFQPVSVTRIGPHQLGSRVVLAPMAGISDRPFRRLCRQFGAAVAATEMLSASLQLQQPERAGLRGIHREELSPRVVQIAGADPQAMAAAARLNVEQGAEIIDINMGCPVKKVLKQAAGSALLRDEPLVEAILRSVVQAVDVPVTLKIRTGWSPECRNGVRVAKIAEDCGIQALAVHGRTRACMFNGHAEYDTIAAIKAAVRLPVFANGDIDSPEKAAFVLAHTGADAVMIGRAARGCPWLFRDIAHFLTQGSLPPPLPASVVRALVLQHVAELHAFYGLPLGLGFARKHVTWYLEPLGAGVEFRRFFNALDSAAAQLESLDAFFASPLLTEAAA